MLGKGGKVHLFLRRFPLWLVVQSVSQFVSVFVCVCEWGVWMCLKMCLCVFLVVVFFSVCWFVEFLWQPLLRQYSSSWFSAMFLGRSQVQIHGSGDVGLPFDVSSNCFLFFCADYVLSISSWRFIFKIKKKKIKF